MQCLRVSADQCVYREGHCVYASIVQKKKEELSECREETCENEEEWSGDEERSEFSSYSMCLMHNN